MPALGHYDQHPNYPGQAYIAGKKIKLGQNRINVPEWDVEVARGTPWFGGTALESDDRGVNLAGIAYEWFTDDVAWLGLPDIRLDQPSFESVRTTTDSIRTSPLITDQGGFRERLASLSEYGDIWVRIKDGSKIELGRWEHGNINIAALPTIDDSDLTEEPDITPSTFDDCATKVTVTYADREHNFEDQNSEPASNPYLLKLIGEPREVFLRRPWITDGALANRYAAEYAAMHARPRISGTVKIKRERAKAKGLHVPGKLFVLNWASHDPPLAIVMRSTEVAWPGDKEAIASLTVENERAIWPSLYIPPPAPKPGNFVIQSVAIQNARIFELPGELRTSPFRQILVLAQRPSDIIIGFRLHVSSDAGSTYDLVEPQNNFAAYGKVVTANYPDNTDIIDSSVGIQVELFGVDTVVTQTDTQRDDGRMLLIVDNEIMSVGQVTALGAGKYRIYVRRAQFGTRKTAHNINATCWFILRERIVRVQSDAHFKAGTTRHFKLQPFTATDELALTAIAPITYTFPALSAALVAPYALKTVREYRVDRGGGSYEAHVVFTWDYSLEQDVDFFEIQWRAGGLSGLEGDWASVVLADVGEEITDVLGVPQFKRQRHDLVVGASNRNYEIRVRAISSTGDASDWSWSLSRRAVSSSSADTPPFFHFLSRSQAESTSLTTLPEGGIVWVTIDGKTHTRQLQSGAPQTPESVPPGTDWNVANEPTLRLRKTGGL